MAHQQFHIADENPNVGGGCVCSETACEDCTGPYAIFPGNEFDNNISPHVVIGIDCAVAVAEELSRCSDDGPTVVEGSCEDDDIVPVTDVYSVDGEDSSLLFGDDVPDV